MDRIHRFWIAASLILGSAYTAAAQDSSTSGPVKWTSFQQLILAKENEAVAAVEKKDIPTFADMLAGDFLMIDDDGFWDKRTYLKSFDEDVAWQDLKMENVKVVPQGKSAATISYRQKWSGLDRGKPFEVVIYTHGHWTRRDGKWVVSLYQDAPAEKNATPADETKPLQDLPRRPAGREAKSLNETIITNERAFLEALTKSDSSALERFLADDFLAIDSSGFAGKSEYLKTFETRKEQQHAWTGYELEQAQVLPFGQDSAVFIKKLTLLRIDHGKPLQVTVYGHDDWEMHSGRWRMTTSQNTQARQ